MLWMACKVGAKYVTKFCSAGLNVIGSSIFAWLNTFVWHNKSETFFCCFSQAFDFSLSSKTPWKNEKICFV